MSSRQMYPNRPTPPARPCAVVSRTVVGYLRETAVYCGELRCDDGEVRPACWVGDRPDRAYYAPHPPGMVAGEGRLW